MASVARVQASDSPGRPGRAGDISLAAGVLSVVFVILVPLPPQLMDVLLVCNITLSLIILMTTASVKRPLELSVFPSLLLLVTFFRLALNIATTRLILVNAADRELAAAGNVVQAFANFVAGSNLIVGLVIFAIIVVVQFVVITRGTTRISEVAARFALDAMPGKQLSIDGDFSAGAVSQEEAQRRRHQIHQEADFYGAMDGASKFVRGEAIASLVITLTNLVGGFILGTLYEGMSFERAAGIFGRLTVGDGLVTQVPALMVSLATAFLITKSSDSAGLGEDLRRQLLANDRVFFIAAVFLLVLVPSGLPVPLLCLGSMACAAVGLILGREEESAAARAEKEDEVPASPESPQEKARSLLVLEPIELEIGYRLVNLVDDSRGGDLMARLSSVRERIAAELGLVAPSFRVRDNTRLHPGEYRIKLRGDSVGHWRVPPGKFLVITEGDAPEGLEGTPGIDPATGKSGIWVSEVQLSEVARAGYPVRKVSEIVTEHLGKVLRAHAAEILTREEVTRLVSDLRRRAPALVEELVPGILKVSEVHKVLQNLLREQVSIRNLELILEVLADHGDRTRDPGELTEHVRRALARTICAPLVAEDGLVHAALLDPALEEFLQSSLEKTEHGSRLSVEPEMADALVDAISKVFQSMESARRKPVLVCSGMIRSHLRNLLVRKAPLAAVLAYEEVTDDFRLEVFSSVALEKVN